MVGNFNNTRLNFKGLFLGLFVFIAVFGMVFACKAPVTPTVPEPEKYTVTFRFNGTTRSETYTAGEELELLTEEEAGISADYELEWYTDSDFTKEAHGGTPVNSNLDIYGKLTKIDTSKEYTVKFVNDGGTALGEEQKVNAGGSATVPVTPTPEKSEHEGWIFSGWSLSPDGTDFLSVSDGKISIKASWAGVGNVITIYAVYIAPDSQKPVIGIELSPGEDFELYVGDTKNLTVLYTPEDANVGRDLSWTCEPAGIVGIESTADGGKVTALSEGSATITVKLSGNETITDSVTVTVREKTVTGVVLTASGSSVSVGGSLNLTLTATYSDGSSGNITEGVTYAVSPEGSGTVEDNVFTALASGSVTVTATYEGKTYKVDITVNEVNVSSKSGVMLQGFNWSSAKRGDGYSWENRSPNWDYWYKVMIDQGAVIGDTFAYVWCPPPSRTDTASSEGYGPTMLNDLNSCYGTKEELSRVIEAIKPAKAIADVVVNHRAGTTCWGDFTNPDWGVVKESNYQVICSDDEGFTGSPNDPHMSGVPSNMRGAPDTGATYAAYRDLDHTNLVVQQGIVDWMNNVLKPAGFVGWRYDYVKGFSGNYVGQYNEDSGAEFSVGEYWPTAGYNSGNPSAWGNEIKNWIQATDKGGTRSKAFDFALKGAMNTVFGNKATGVANSNYQLLADSSNLIMSQPADAVTFIDNHDTGSTQSHWYLDPQDVGTAYAFILTHPGYPCVAWQHYFTFAESGSKVDPDQYIGGNMVPGTENTYRQHIDYLIDLRQRIGIEYDDVVDVVGKSSNYYAGKITGLNGEIVVVIGNGYTPSGEGYEGNNPIYAGTNFAIWEKGVNGNDSIGGGGTEPGETVSITVTCAGDWIWNDGVKIFAWVWGGSYGGGQWIPCSGSGTTVNFDVTDDLEKFLLVRCNKDTITPDWSQQDGDNAGRVYNKTGDISVVAGQSSYTVNFEEYPKKNNN